MTGSSDYRIIRNALDAFCIDDISSKIRRIVMIATDEKNIVVALCQTLVILLYNIVIVAASVESEPAVTGNDNQRILQTVLVHDATHEETVVPVYITRHDKRLDVWKLI
jgi:hypothetical protein